MRDPRSGSWTGIVAEGDKNSLHISRCSSPSATVSMLEPPRVPLAFACFTPGFNVCPLWRPGELLLSLDFFQSRNKGVAPEDRRDIQPDEAFCFEGAEVGKEVVPELDVKCLQPILKHLAKCPRQIFLIVKIDDKKLAPYFEIIQRVVDRFAP